MPLPTLRLHPHGHRRTVRGHRGSLDLRCRALPSPPPCRFIPAHLRDGPPPCPGPVLCLSRFLPLEELPPPRVFHGDSRATGSPVPCKSLNRARALFTPDAAGAVSRSPPGLSQDRIHSPGFDITLSISTLPQGFGFTRLHDPHLTQSQTSGSWRCETVKCSAEPLTSPSKEVSRYGHVAQNSSPWSTSGGRILMLLIGRGFGGFNKLPQRRRSRSRRWWPFSSRTSGGLSLCRVFSATLTTPALNRRSSRWFAASSCKATAEGLPPSLAQHRQPADRTYATR